jgi:hypothetical protein
MAAARWGHAAMTRVFVPLAARCHAGGHSRRRGLFPERAKTHGCCAAVAPGRRSGGPAVGVRILHPVPYQVIQRDAATVRGRGGAAGHRPGSAPVPLALGQAGPWQWRAVPLAGAFGAGTDWAAVETTDGPGRVTATITVPAGGWFRLEVRRPGAAGVAAVVEPLGVGELFLVAGQSYAENCNDERLCVQEPHGRVVALDLAKGAWAVAHDPQPDVASSYRDGSIWPACGDDLVRALGVPVGFVNVAKAATASKQWLPGGPLHANLVRAAKALGRFRAVLWQQGESDVIARTTEEAPSASAGPARCGPSA